MTLGFILPSKDEYELIGRCAERIRIMRPDQIDYLEHLLSSWGVDSAATAWRAVKRTLRERP